MKRVAVLVSGGGSNLQALLDAARCGDLCHGEIALVVSSKADAKALQRAQRADVPTVAHCADDCDGSKAYDEKLLALLQEMQIDIVVLAGFLPIVGPAVLERYKNRIINVHPSLLPAFGGSGFYGLKVHEAALQRGVQYTGATVHLVNDVVDGGQILLQQVVPVEKGDTAKTLQQRVMQQAEWVLLPKALNMLCGGEFDELINAL